VSYGEGRWACCWLSCSALSSSRSFSREPVGA
jgi:hypothetical protein